MAAGSGLAERDGGAGGGRLDVVGDRVEGGGRSRAGGSRRLRLVSRLRGWLVRPAAYPRGRIGRTRVHRPPPRATLSDVRAGPDTSLAESVHIYNCRSHLRRNLDAYRNGAPASADGLSEIPPDPHSRTGRGGCYPGGFVVGGVLVRTGRSGA